MAGVMILPAFALRRFVLPLLLALPVLALPGIAGAVPEHVYPQLLKACLDWDGNPGTVLIGCNAVIREGKEDAKLTAMAHNNRGVAYDRTGNSNEALADYNAAIALDPDYANAYSNRGTVYAERGEFDAAFADFDKALRLKPGFEPTLRARAEAWQRSGQYERALAQHNEFVRSSLNKWRSLHERGDLLLAMGRADEALADYDRVLRMEPQDDAAYHQRARAWQMKGDAARALADYDRAMSLGRDSPAANTLAGRGWALAVLGQPEEAMAVCDRVLKTRPHAELYVTRGFVLLMRGQFAAALSDFDAALLKKPALAEARFGRGLARLKLGDGGGADDIAAARKILPPVGVQFAVAGLKP
ncbi:MAG: tetratricopeptide repeat protein [Reyranellaceae bacterium]